VRKLTLSMMACRDLLLHMGSTLRSLMATPNTFLDLYWHVSPHL
jgi:hypothetical protein